MVLTNHLRDTAIEAVLLRPRVPRRPARCIGLQAHLVGRREPGRRRLEEDRQVHRFSTSTSGHGLQRQDRSTYRLTLRPRRPRRRRDPRYPHRDGARVVPGLGFLDGSTPGSTVRSSSRPDFETEVQAGEIPPGVAGQPPGESCSRRRHSRNRPHSSPTSSATARASTPSRPRRQTSARTRSTLTVRAWPDDSAWSDRVSGLVTRALPALSARIGQPWPRDGGLVIQEAVGRSTGGYAGLFDPKAGESRSPISRTIRSSSMRRPRVVQRLAPCRSLGERGVCVLLRVRGGSDSRSRPGRHADPGRSRRPAHPAQRLGRRRCSGHDDRGLRLCRLARRSPAPIAQRAGADGLHAVWADAASTGAAYQPARGGTIRAARGRAAATTGDGRPIGAACLDLLEARTGSPFDDLWRTWVARPEGLPLLDARAAARAAYAALVAAAGTGSCPPVRDAHARAGSSTQRTDCSRRHGRPRRSGSRSRPAAASVRAELPARRSRTAFEGPAALARRREGSDRPSRPHRSATTPRIARGRATRRDLRLIGRDPGRARRAAAFSAGTCSRGHGAARPRRPPRGWGRAVPGAARRRPPVVSMARTRRAAAVPALFRSRPGSPRGLRPVGGLRAGADHEPSRARPPCRRVRRSAQFGRPPGATERVPGADPYGTLAATSGRRRRDPSRGSQARRERNRTDGPARARGRRTRSSRATRPTSTSRAPRRILDRGRPGPARHDGGLRPRGRRPVRDRRGAQPARPRPRRRRPDRDPARGARRRRRRSSPRRSSSGSAPAIAGSACTRRRSSACSPSRPAGRPPPATASRPRRPDPVISFGARHVHPDITDVLDYAAIVGGCVGPRRRRVPGSPASPRPARCRTRWS